MCTKLPYFIIFGITLTYFLINCFVMFFFKDFRAVKTFSLDLFFGNETMVQFQRWDMKLFFHKTQLWMLCKKGSNYPYWVKNKKGC